MLERQVPLGEGRQDADHHHVRADLATWLSASLRLCRSVSSNVVSPPSRSFAGGTLISMLNWPSSVTKLGIGDRLQRLGVLQRRVAVLVDQVELDLQPGHRVVGVEPRLPQHPGEDVEAAPHLLPVPGAVGSGELLCFDLFAHGTNTRDHGSRRYGERLRPGQRTVAVDHLLPRPTAAPPRSRQVGRRSRASE